MAGWTILGVPSSAAAHWPGIEKAPAALRAAGLVERLRASGLDVDDAGDLPVARWAPSPGSTANNVRAVADGLRVVRDTLAPVVASARRPLVIGGECTLAIAVVSALSAEADGVGLLYVDGGQDLMIPAEHPDEPILDGTGVAHLLDLPGALDELADIGPRRPLLSADRLVFFGYADEEEDVHGLVPSMRLPATLVAAEPEAAAERALAALSVDRFVLHVDVDVLDFLAFPAADVPMYGRGLSVEQLTRALRVLASDPRCAALLLVEFNPDHGVDATADRLVSLLTDVLGA